jgi:pimeloyl-ACP methyl ester carboxylesterase
MVGDAVWARLSEGDRAARRSEGDALLDDLRSARNALDVPDPLHLHVAVHSARGELSRPRLRWAAGELADRFGTPLVEIPGARHGAHLTHPDHFAGWITSLVGGSRAP